ncbi:MAG: peptidoglycan recognition family protein [Phycisphaerales bacterium]
MHERPEDHVALSRREALRRAVRLAGAGVAGLALTACASSSRSSGFTLLTPEERARLREPVTVRPYHPQYGGASGWTNRGGVSGAIPRSNWAGGGVEPSLMNRMLPIDKITIHHDGMSAFTSTSRSAGASRVEAIRLAHRGQNWGDVGYHYLVDPSGRVWEGRPLEWQGAHVGGQNQGNIGICVMGNFERQHPNSAQIAAVENSVAELMQKYRIRLNQIRTHQEMAATACPGRYLQPQLVAMRSSRGTLGRYG